MPSPRTSTHSDVGESFEAFLATLGEGQRDARAHLTQPVAWFGDGPHPLHVWLEEYRAEWHVKGGEVYTRSGIFVTATAYAAAYLQWLQGAPAKLRDLVTPIPDLWF